MGWLLLAIAGCQHHAPPATRPLSLPATTTQYELRLSANPTIHSGEDPRDAQPQLAAMVHLDIYLLDLPPNTVSSNKEFWKRVDEEAVGVGSRDLLEKNGFRAGIAPRSEAVYFGAFFNQIPHPPTKRSSVNGLHEETIRIDAEESFDSQDLFVYLAGEKQPQGKSYFQGTNNLMLTFGPTPRDPSAVRMTICPIVHSLRRHTDFTLMNQEYQSTEKETDRLYDLNLTADIPENCFFIIAPGPDAKRRTSLGNCFLIKQSPTERREQVIMIVPTFIRVDGKRILMRDPLVK
jgi:hypothetical protein